MLTNNVVLPFIALGLAALTASAADLPAGVDTRCYEMRIYYAAPGKLEALQSRFRDHTLKLFEKHGMANIGYWVPADNTNNQLTYILAYPSREAREKSWKAFGADPDWQQARKASEVDGKLTRKAADVTFLQATDFSPAIKPSAASAERTFELRTYKCTPNHLPNLLARFRDHTCKLFEKHGIQNIAYWTPTEAAKGAEDTLIYLLAHRSQEAAAESFKNFRADPAWLAARQASEQSAGGSLTVTNGVQSVFMKPTDFSPFK